MSGGPSTGPGAPGSRVERAARFLVRAAQVLVPRVRRSTWLEEWEAEIWHHLHRHGGDDGSGDGPDGSGRAGAALLLRCLGAFPHALLLRLEEWDLDALVPDVRYALRSLARRPAFALVAVGSLALGIGGNTAVFSVVDAVLLRPLPFPHADRVVWTWGRSFQGRPTASVSPPDFLDQREATDGVLERYGAFASFAGMAVHDAGERPIELQVRPVSHDLLAVLGLEPALGRGFTEEETRGATTDVALLSHGTWGRLYGFDPGVVGTTIRLDDQTPTVVGVLPEGLDFPAGDVWVPLTLGADWYGSRASHFLRPLGLLAPGVELEEAQRALDVVSARLEAAYPETNEGWYPLLQPLQTVFVGDVRPALWLLWAAVGLVLVIASANVANLLLARAVARRGEVAVRVALGASRGRIVRQLLTESLALAFVAGVLGVALARLGVWVLLRLEPGNLPRLEEVAIDGGVLAFTVTVTAAVGLLFGLFPALGLTSRDVTTPLRATARGASGQGRRLRSGLIAGEVALSFVLVTGALLLARSFAALRSVDPGIDPAGVVALSLTLPDDASSERTVRLDALVERARAHPAVAAAGAATALPFSGQGGDTYVHAEGRPPARIQNIENTALLRTVTEGYFGALDHATVRGRVFGPGDDPGAPPRTVINQALAARLFPGEDPVGRRLVAWLDTVTALEVVGVVADVRQFGLATPPVPEFFLSARQFPPGSLELVVRGTDGAPAGDALRAALWEADPSQPLTRLTSVETLVQGSLAPGRFQALLLGLFAGLAVLLSAVGLYGVLAEAVGEQRREIGLRMALGAAPGSVVRGVVARGLRVAGVGIALGALGAWAASGLLTSMLFGVGPRDPVAFAATPLFLLVVVLLASWAPAAHAARVDPVQALRDDG